MSLKLVMEVLKVDLKKFCYHFPYSEQFSLVNFLITTLANINIKLKCEKHLFFFYKAKGGKTNGVFQFHSLKKHKHIHNTNAARRIKANDHGSVGL